MVQGRIGIQQIDPAPRSPGFCIRAAENDAVRTAVDDSSCAHGARLLGDIQGAAFQPPVAQSLLGRRQGNHLRMGRSILERLHLVPAPADHAAILHHNGSNRHFPFHEGLSGFFHGLAHEPFVRTGHFHHYGGYHGPGGAVLASSFWKILIVFYTISAPCRGKGWG